MRILPIHKYLIGFSVALAFFLYQAAMAYCSLHDPSTHIDAGEIIFIHTDAQKPSLPPFIPQSEYHNSLPEYAGKAMFVAKKEPYCGRITLRGLLASRAPPR